MSKKFSGARYTDAEIEFITESYEAGLSDPEIAAAMLPPLSATARTAAAIAAFRVRMSLHRYAGQSQEDAFRNADELFQDAMNMALARGKERMPFVAPLVPLYSVPLRFQPEPMHSGCTSSASLCADI